MRISLAVFSPLLFLPTFLLAQSGNPTLVKGRITDTETLLGVPYASVSALGVNIGVRSDETGRFVLRSEKPFTELRVQQIGLKTQTIKIQPGVEQTIDVLMEPLTEQLKEVTVRPEKYRNKNNPAVELIQLVVENRDKNRVENLHTFREEQYEKTYLGLSSLPDGLKTSSALKDLRFVLENADTGKIAGKAIVPVMLQENIIDYVSRNPPQDAKKRVRAAKSVEFPDYFEQEGLNKALQYLNQDINIYDNYIVLLTNHFLSPIANNAPLFYRYYPMDTSEEAGSKIVRLSFFPRNKTDMLLQGDLYVSLDSTYPVTRIAFEVNPNINLNWVRSLKMEQSFQRLPSGKWLLAFEDYRMDFGVTKKGFGVFGQRMVSHREPAINAPLADSLFRYPEDVVYLPGSTTLDTTFWNLNRHVKLNTAEAATYGNMDSLQRTPLFRNVGTAALIASVGYVKTVPEFEIGPINTFYAFNAVEGNRVRFGGRTTSEMSKKFRVEGYGAYGFKDANWKYGGNLYYALGDTRFNKFPFNILRLQIQNDIRIPGQELRYVQSGSFLTSFTRGVNDKFVYFRKINLHYEREYLNHFSYILGTEKLEQRPAGALHFDPTDDQLKYDAPVISAEIYTELRYAPGEKFFQTATYRQLIDFNYIFTLRYARGIDGYVGGQYDYDRLNFSAYKFSKLPPIGYNYLWMEAGAVLGKVPYPLLNIHRANQTYIYQLRSYNLMNFMEFMSDRYVAINMDHNFYGFFFNKVPLLRRLKLREMASVKVLWGGVTQKNLPTEGNSGLYKFPSYPDGTPISYTFNKGPYVEASLGVGNIFKILRIDLVRRFNYLDNPNVFKFGIRGQIEVNF